MTRDDLQGTCRELKLCKSVIEDLKEKSLLPKLCPLVDQKAIKFCCRTNEQPSNIRTHPRFAKDECKYPDYAVTVERDYNTSKKSWNKCIDLADSVFPCKYDHVTTNKTRKNTCEQGARKLIIDGEKTKQNEFPHMAVLGYDNKKNFTTEWKCGGTLISEQWVMSAAHCYYDKQLKVNVSRVRLGGGNLQDNPDAMFMFTIIEKVLHPNYKGHLIYNDILLLKLDRSVEYSKTIRPACLHVGNNITDERAIVIGYGRTDVDDEVLRSNLLLKAILNKFSNEECSRVFSEARKRPDGVRHDTQICYGSKNDTKDSCNGDSGGPLQIPNPGVHCTYIVIGITSVGKMCGITGFPALYTRVSAFVPWIESVVWPN